MIFLFYYFLYLNLRFNIINSLNSVEFLWKMLLLQILLPKKKKTLHLTMNVIGSTLTG